MVNSHKRTAKNSPWLNFNLWTILTSILIFPMYCALAPSMFVAGYRYVNCHNEGK